MNMSSLTDHTNLQPAVTIAAMEKLCLEATEYGFRAVCIPPLFTKKVKAMLAGTSIKTAVVIGFPFGYSAIEAKLAETLLAIVDGADELDIVICLAALKNGDWQYLAKEINTILPVVKAKGRTVKMIIETGILDDHEIIACCDLYGAAGVDFIKTSTGFTGKGASLEAVKLLRKHLADVVRINASGFIGTFEFAKQLTNVGADHISPVNTIEIVKQVHF